MLKRVHFFIVCVAALSLMAVGVCGEDTEIPEYIGSQACLGCHVETYSAWKSSSHATMVVPILNSTDLPLSIEQASPELGEELRKADFMIANSFFVAREPASQHYKMLKVIYDKTAKTYRSSNLSLDWSTQCAGCHTTNMNTPDLTWGEAGIGCEACHGPGRDHATSMGDKTKIVSGKDADICGQCHGGHDVQGGGNLMADGTKWVVGFRPGMQLSSVPGIQLTPVDPSKTPPDADVGANHLRNYNMWKASGHGNSLKHITDNERATADCYGCHSAEGFISKLKGESLDITGKENFNSISCVACHDPHNSLNPHHLVLNSEKLCSSCHTQGGFLQGTGAQDVEDTRSLHSGLKCPQCHMTEANHLMKVVRPDAPDLAERRKDSCTACHVDYNKNEMAAILQGMQNRFTERMNALQSEVQTIAAAVRTNPEQLSAEVKPKFDSARMNLSLLQRDGSRGAHNFEYATKVMDKAQKDIEIVSAAINH